MKIKDYIVSILYSANGTLCDEVCFDIGSDDGINIKETSTNRIKFKVIRY